jgi:hypothetical protein
MLEQQDSMADKVAEASSIFSRAQTEAGIQLSQSKNLSIIQTRPLPPGRRDPRNPHCFCLARWHT